MSIGQRVERGLMRNAKWRKWIVWGAAGLAGVVLPRLIWFRSEPLPADAQMRALVRRGADPLAIAHIKRGHSRLVIIAHGFMDAMNRPGMAALADALSEQFDVLTFDFRGHGRSGGRSSLNFCEAAADLQSVIRYASACGYGRIGVVGYSMGAAAAIMAAAQGAPVEAVASVCCPMAAPRLAARARSAAMPTWPWRWWSRLMGVRLGAALTLGAWPIHYVARVAPIPLLVVHHGRDIWVRRDESEALFAVARPPKQYLYVPGAYHARAEGSAAQVIAWLGEHMPLSGAASGEEQS